MRLDHLNLYVRSVADSRALYEPLLGAFGYVANREFGEVAVGFGDANYAVLALVRTTLAIEPTHLAFAVDDRAEVDRFHALGRTLGWTCNGEPGLRPHYHEHYYAAFLRDVDGHNVEMVCHEPVGT